MTAYPQLMQFPVTKRRRLRTVLNAAEDGSAIKLADSPGETTEWQLVYSNLTDAEAASLGAFFATVEGSLNGFTFLDPMANLLTFSDELDHAAWLRGPAMTVEQVAGRSGCPTWLLINSGAGAQSITQTLSAPDTYVYCLSAYVRCAGACNVAMLIGNQRSERVATPAWTRIVFAASSAPTFGLELPAGSAIDVAGMQVEAQSAASVYKPSTTGGVYEDARLRDDVLAITCTGVNQHKCAVNIFHAKHL
jgi:hypothetical protein